MSQVQSPIAPTTPEALRAAIAEAVQVDAQQLQAAVGSIQVATSEQLQIADPQIKWLYDRVGRTLTLLADRIPAGQEAEDFAAALIQHLGQQAAGELLGEDVLQKRHAVQVERNTIPLGRIQAAMAERALEAYNFGEGVAVAGLSDFEYYAAGHERSCEVYLENVIKDGKKNPSIRLGFTVRYDPQTGALSEAYAEDATGTAYGCMPAGQIEKLNADSGIVKVDAPAAALSVLNENACRMDHLVGKDFKILPFRELPHSHQLAIIQYMPLDDGDLPDTLEAMLPRYLLEHGDDMWGVVDLPAERLKQSVMADEDRATGSGGWEEYAAEYCATGDVPHYASDNRWPVLLSADNYETLLDGWHRMHSYMRSGFVDVPALFAPEERHYELFATLKGREQAAAPTVLVECDQKVGGRENLRQASILLEEIRQLQDQVDAFLSEPAKQLIERIAVATAEHLPGLREEVSSFPNDGFYRSEIRTALIQRETELHRPTGENLQIPGM